MSGLFEAFTEKSDGKTVENTATPYSNEPVKIEKQNNYRKGFKEFIIKMRSNRNQENGESKYIHLRNAEVWEIFSTGLNYRHTLFFTFFLHWIRLVFDPRPLVQQK